MSAQDYKNLRDALSTASVSVAQQLSKLDSLACKVNGRSDTISRRFPKWKVAANATKSEVYLHYFGNNLANTEYQVTVLADGFYKFIVSSNIGTDRAFFLRGREGVGGGAHILRGRTHIEGARGCRRGRTHIEGAHPH